MWWKKDDPSDKDAVRLVEALLGEIEQKSSNVIDITKRIRRKPGPPKLTVIKPER